MSFSRDMIGHAIRLAAQGDHGPTRGAAQNIWERRAVSAAYYALFHHLKGAAVDLIAPNVHQESTIESRDGLNMQK